MFFLLLDYEEDLNGQVDETINVPNEDNKLQEPKLSRQEPAANISIISSCQYIVVTLMLSNYCLLMMHDWI